MFKQPSTMSFTARRSFTTAARDFDTWSGCGTEFNSRLDAIGRMGELNAQRDALGGFCTLWEQAMGDDSRLTRVAAQLARTASAMWFGFSHQCALMKVTEELAYRATSAGNMDAMRIIERTFESYYLDILDHNVDKGTARAMLERRKAAEVAAEEDAAPALRARA